MPLETVPLYNIPEEPHAMSAQLLALIAYPTDKMLRNEFEFCLRAHALRLRISDDHKWSVKVQHVVPRLLVEDPSVVRKVVEKGFVILKEKRRVAASMMLPMLNGHVGSKVEFDFSEYDEGTAIRAYRETLQHPSINKLAEQFAADLNYDPKMWSKRGAIHRTRETIYSDFWSPAKPIAFLLPSFISGLYTYGTKGEHALWDLMDPEWARTTLEQYVPIRELLLTLSGREDSTFNFREEELIEISHEGIVKSIS